MNSKDIKTLLKQLNKRSDSQEVQEKAITWSESALNSIEDKNAIQLLLLLIEIKTTPSIVTSFVDKLIISDFNSEFILKIIAKISLKFSINSKKLLSFLVPIKNRFSALILSNFWSNNPKSRETIFKQLIQELQQKLDSNDVISADIRFNCQLLALLITNSGQFSLPIKSLLKIINQLSTPPTSDPTIVVSLRESAFYILDSLLVTLENDFLIFCNQINKTIVDSIELEIPTIDAFLVKYLSMSSSFRFNSQQLNQILKSLLERIHSNQYNSNAFKCINAIVSAHFPYVECSDWLEIYEQLTKLLLQYYRSKEPKSLENSVLRRELIEVIHALNTSHTTLSILNLALIRDENHVIRDFCGKSLRKIDKRVEQNIEPEIEPELELEPEKEVIEEPMGQLNGQMEEISDEEVMIIDEEVIDGAEELLKDFVFE